MAPFRFLCYPVPILTLTIIANMSLCNLLIEGASPIAINAATKLAFAGFGVSKAPATKKKKESKKQPIAVPDLSTADGRMAHIASCIQQADVSPMGRGLGNSICCIDNFLGAECIAGLRTEAESLLHTMVPSQSTRWEEATQSVMSYQKEGVLSTQIEGGTDGYKVTPRLVEYIVTLTKNLSEKVNALVPPESQLSEIEQTNKLAVCLGEGSKYDKHIDNLGGDATGQADLRKMTALLYLQTSGSHSNNIDDDQRQLDPRGGYFRAYDVPEIGDVKAFSPRGDRLLLFWSDSLVHDVSPSFAPSSVMDRRWALTVWFVIKDGGTIRATDAIIENRHFGTG